MSLDSDTALPPCLACAPTTTGTTTILGATGVVPGGSGLTRDHGAGRWRASSLDCTVESPAQSFRRRPIRHHRRPGQQSPIRKPKMARARAGARVRARARAREWLQQPKAQSNQRARCFGRIAFVFQRVIILIVINASESLNF